MDRSIFFDDNKDIQVLFGKYDQNLHLIEKELNVKISRQDRGLKISGDRPRVNKACDLFDYLKGMADSGS